MTRPTIALLTDFGLEDTYVGIMKCVIADITPEARVIDLCHRVPPQNLLSGAHLAATAVPHLPEGSVMVAVVDPGVGSKRRAVAVDVGHATLVGPDNGLFDLVLKNNDVENVVALEEDHYFRPEVSATFHGRDVFAPTGAHIASGVSLDDMGPSLTRDDLVRLPPSAPFFREERIESHVIHIDRFGNLITNLSEREMEDWLEGAAPAVELAGSNVPLEATFSDAPKNAAIAYFGSSGQLEIAVNNGDAAHHFDASQGSSIFVTKKEGPGRR